MTLQKDEPKPPTTRLQKIVWAVTLTVAGVLRHRRDRPGHRATTSSSSSRHPHLAPVFDRAFLTRPSVEVAPLLLGAVIHGRGVSVRLTEVEAYLGEVDPGSHAFRGETPRNRVMYGEPGPSVHVLHLRNARLRERGVLARRHGNGRPASRRRGNRRHRAGSRAAHDQPKGCRPGSRPGPARGRARHRAGRQRPGPCERATSRWNSRESSRRLSKDRARGSPAPAARRTTRGASGSRAIPRFRPTRPRFRRSARARLPCSSCQPLTPQSSKSKATTRVFPTSGRSSNGAGSCTCRPTSTSCEPFSRAIRSPTTAASIRPRRACTSATSCSCILMRRLQLAGHKPLGLVGGSTGSSVTRSPTAERTLNTRETVAEWVGYLQSQVSKFLSFEGTTPRDSSTTWTGPRRCRPSTSCATSASTTASARCSRRMPSARASTPTRASATRSSATRSCRGSTSASCTSTTAACCRPAAPTSGATSRAAST